MNWQGQNTSSCCVKPLRSGNRLLLRHNSVYPKSRVANTRPTGRIRPPILFFWLAPCFYLAAAPSSLPLVKEWLHVYSPKIIFGPLKATSRLMWPPVKMSVAPSLSDTLFTITSVILSIKILISMLLHYQTFQSYCYQVF